jgi:hypothetical protein
MPTINNKIYIGKISSHLKFPPFSSEGQWFYFIYTLKSMKFGKIFSIVKFWRKFNRMRFGKLLPHGVMGTKTTKFTRFPKPRREHKHA